MLSFELKNKTAVETATTLAAVPMTKGEILRFRGGDKFKAFSIQAFGTVTFFAESKLALFIVITYNRNHPERGGFYYVSFLQEMLYKQE